MTSCILYFQMLPVEENTWVLTLPFRVSGLPSQPTDFVFVIFLLQLSGHRSTAEARPGDLVEAGLCVESAGEWDVFPNFRVP